MQNSKNGVLLAGYDPVDVYTRQRRPSYAADNFIFRTYPDGREQFLVIDDRGVVANTNAESITNKAELQKLLREFRWER